MGMSKFPARLKRFTVFTTTNKIKRDENDVGLVEKFVKGKLDIWWTLQLSSSSPHLIKKEDPKDQNRKRKSLLIYSNCFRSEGLVLKSGFLRISLSNRSLVLAFNEGLREIKSTDMPEEESIDIKFRLYDGSDIGPFHYSSSSTVDFLKQRVVSDWPKGKTVVPKGINEVKLISSGKILENSKTVGQCKTPFGEVAGGVTVMHVVVQPSLAKTKTEKKVDKAPKAVICTCTIL